MYLVKYLSVFWSVSQNAAKRKQKTEFLAPTFPSDKAFGIWMPAPVIPLPIPNSRKKNQNTVTFPVFALIIPLQLLIFTLLLLLLSLLHLFFFLSRLSSIIHQCIVFRPYWRHRKQPWLRVKNEPLMEQRPGYLIGPDSPVFFYLTWH